MSWYQSQWPKALIERLFICENLPEGNWDEQWTVEEWKAKCARNGLELYLTGAHIPLVGEMFADFVSVREIVGLNQLDASETKDFSRIFANCRALKQLSLSAWNCSKAERMDGLFEGCIALESVDLSTWPMASVRGMSRMFLECNRLKKIAVAHWDVSNVEDFSHTFACCYDLEELDVSVWKTESARTFEGMFNRCGKLAELNIEQWSTENVRNFKRMFHRCGGLKKLNLRNWKLRKDATFSRMFLGTTCQLQLPRDRRFRTLAEGDSWFRKNLLPAQLKYITKISIHKKLGEPVWMDCCWPADELDSGALLCIKKGDELQLDCRGGSIYSHENSHRAFSIPDHTGTSWLREIEGLQLLKTRHTRDFSEMFAGNVGVLRLAVADFDTRSAENLTAMFQGCKKLQEADISRWDRTKVQCDDAMFKGCESLSRKFKIVK